MRLLLSLLLALPLLCQEKKFEMRFYVLAILEKGPKYSADKTPENAELGKGHMANIQRLADEKKLILAGPLAGAGDMAGIFLFDTDSLETAKSWCDSDPAVKAGRFQCRLLKWYSAKGIGILPDQAK